MPPREHDKKTKGAAFLILTAACIGMGWVSHVSIHAVADLEGIVDPRANEVSMYMMGAIALLWLLATVKLFGRGGGRPDSTRALDHR